MLPAPNEEAYFEVVPRWKNVDAKVKQKSVYLAWCVWNDHNKLVFEQKSTSKHILVFCYLRLVEEYGKYAKRIYGGRVLKSNKSTGSRIWQPPPIGFAKVKLTFLLTMRGGDRVGSGSTDEKR